MELGAPFKILARQIWIKAEDRKPPVAGDVIVPKAVQASSSDAGAEVANLINRSGLSNRDTDSLEEHSDNPAHMWRSAKGDAASWVEFDLGQVQPLGTISIFNYNDGWHTDRGVRKADISVWTQETGWQKIQDDMAIEQAEGNNDYDEPMFVAFDNVKAQKIRFDDMASYGDAEFIGLSEVQFYAPRGPQAIRPTPAEDAAGVNISDLELTWSAGEGAETHRVYLGTSPNDLKPLGRIEQTSAKLSRLAADTKYCWRIDEVRADESVAAGKVWTFTTGGAKLAAWWKLDESEGTKVADSSGNGHDGVIHGEPKFQPTGGKVGGAIEFDGVDDYVDTGWAEDLPTWTLAVWVTSPAAPNTTPCSGPVHREANLQINWNHDWDPYRAAAGFRSQSPDAWHGAGYGELQGNRWYHLAATYDGETLKSYKDGVLVTSNSTPSGPPFPEYRSLTIAKNASHPNYFAGTVDDLCVFSYALGADEIKTLYSGTEPIAIAGGTAPSEPRLLQATLPEPAEPAVAASPAPAPTVPATAPVAPIAPAEPNSQVQPVEAESPVADAAPTSPKNWIAVIVVVGIVGVIVGFSFFTRSKPQ